MKKKICFLLFAVVALAVVLYFVFHPIFVYERNYYEQIGIHQSGRQYHTMVEDKGEPIRIERDEDFCYLHYDGLVLGYGNVETGSMEFARITGEQYRFGFWKVGVGTPRQKIESVYRHIQKIKDLPANEFGVIDGSTWVRFRFDENGCVSQITLTQGL